jgi:hypothetical protein
VARRFSFTGMVGGHFPDQYGHDPKPQGASAKVPDRAARPTKPFHLGNQASECFAGRLGGNWLYVDD